MQDFNDWLGQCREDNNFYRIEVGGAGVYHSHYWIPCGNNRIQKTSYTVWDVAGVTNIRPLWRHYFQFTKGIIYVVDSSDSSRIGESREELQRVLEDDTLRDAVLLVFANKNNLPGAMTTLKVTQKLELNKHMNRQWYVQSTCADYEEGIVDGFDWLAKTIKNKN